ncbi:MAG: Uma2 family endonuclease [Schwartzia sp.]|nr:Uma2 family endonuclease [Schwartzia sp. (in: firmicutes)]
MSNAVAYQDENAIITEIINGQEVLMSPRPATRHSRAAGRIYGIFFHFLRKKRCEAFFEHEVHLDDENVFVPDVLIICDKNKIKANWIDGAPDLVVEVLSPSTAIHDRGIKKDAYERAGVKEYWIADPAAKSIEVYYLKGGRLVLDHVYMIFPPEEWERMTEEQRAAARLSVKVSLYDDLIVDVREVFEDIDE